ncbi:MAG: BON domain-containing protein [Gammaproteobacteria bacterium]|nr:BON domain-containing protein [Gammaproteobacteria bacterium]
MFNDCLRILFVLSLALLHGCAGALFAGTVTGAAVVHDQRSTGAIIDDQDIELKAAKANFEDEELRNKTHINVTSFNYIVLVTGEAPTPELKQRMITIVENIPKATKVHDEVTIAEPTSIVARTSDSYITAKVKTKLFTIPDYDPTRVKVVTEKGVVYLMGIVTQEQGTQAADAARSVAGVQKVVKLFEYST